MDLEMKLEHIFSILIYYLDHITFLKLDSILPDYLKIRYYEKQIGLSNLNNLDLYKFLYERSFSSFELIEEIKNENICKIFEYNIPDRIFCFTTKDNKINKYDNEIYLM